MMLTREQVNGLAVGDRLTVRWSRAWGNFRHVERVALRAEVTSVEEDVVWWKCLELAAVSDAARSEEVLATSTGAFSRLMGHVDLSL